MTVEPGIYLPGFGGVRIEDLVLITKDGYRNLTYSRKDLVELQGRQDGFKDDSVSSVSNLLQLSYLIEKNS